MLHRRVHDLVHPKSFGPLPVAEGKPGSTHPPDSESQNFLNVTGFFYFLKYSKFKMLEFLASTG